jgi:hypothetical protein
MAGVDRLTGKPLSGWAHVVQSLGVLFTTPKLSRIMRRHIGTNMPRLVDAPISPVTLIDFYAAVAEALRYEPRFRVSRMGVEGATTDGRLTLAIEGVYFPRGHLGDFSVSEPKTASVAL